MNENVNFRTALHGFNRDDVVAYIEQVSLDHEKEVRALQDANARLLAELDGNNAAEIRKELDEERSQSDQLSARCAELFNENKALKEEIEQLRSAPPAAAEPVSPLDAPIAPVDAEPAASEKDYEAMELAAYRRAEVAERLAKERAAKVYEQLDSVFADANEQMAANDTDLSRLTESLRLNIAQLQDILGAIRGSYNSTKESFRAFSDRNRELADNQD